MAGFWLKYEGTRYPIRRGETLIGRSAYCTIVISDPSISREHAAIRMTAEGIHVVDLGSRNGTFVNGQRVTDTHNLTPGDTLVLGRALLWLVSSEEAVRGRITTQMETPEGDSLEEPTTQTQPVTLALIENLVGRATGGDVSHELAAAIRNAIDAVLVHARSARSPFDSREIERLREMTRTLASWIGDSSLDAWRDDVLERLEGLRQ